MAHPQQLRFVSLLSQCLPRFFNGARVLEVGSLNVNGTIRQFFSQCSYIGIDIAAGDGVDVVCPGQDYDAPDGFFDHVVTCEAMEHNPYWRATFENMIRMCRPGGLVTMACATTGRAEHGTARSDPCSSPLTVEMGWNYYRNLTIRDFRRCVDLPRHFQWFRFWENWEAYDLYFAGVRQAAPRQMEAEGAWAGAERAIEEALRGWNAPIRHRVRRVIAKSMGDAGFEMIRKLRPQRSG